MMQYTIQIDWNPGNSMLYYQNHKNLSILSPRITASSVDPFIISRHILLLLQPLGLPVFTISASMIS